MQGSIERIYGSFDGMNFQCAQLLLRFDVCFLRWLLRRRETPLHNLPDSEKLYEARRVPRTRLQNPNNESPEMHAVQCGEKSHMAWHGTCVGPAFGGVREMGRKACLARGCEVRGVTISSSCLQLLWSKHEFTETRGSFVWLVSVPLMISRSQILQI